MIYFTPHLLLLLNLYFSFGIKESDKQTSDNIHAWLLNDPPSFHEGVSFPTENVMNDTEKMKVFIDMVEWNLPRVDGFTDGITLQ